MSEIRTEVVSITVECKGMKSKRDILVNFIPGSGYNGETNRVGHDGGYLTIHDEIKNFTAGVLANMGCTMSAPGEWGEDLAQWEGKRHAACGTAVVIRDGIPVCPRCEVEYPH